MEQYKSKDFGTITKTNDDNKDIENNIIIKHQTKNKKSIRNRKISNRNCNDGDFIRNSDERNRLLALAQRNFLINRCGITASIYGSFYINKLLTDTDRKKYPNLHDIEKELSKDLFQLNNNNCNYCKINNSVKVPPSAPPPQQYTKQQIQPFHIEQLNNDRNIIVKSVNVSKPISRKNKLKNIRKNKKDLKTK